MTTAEEEFKRNAVPLTTREAKDSFISGSRQSLEHLRLAALTSIRKSIVSQETANEEEITLYHEWEQALEELRILRLQGSEASGIYSAYKVWRERQSDQNDAKPEIFAEQVAYVFFIRLLLVRVLEDKGIITPRLASDGGFSDWRKYVERYFKELIGVSILNKNYCNILTQKAGNYYLHFFQQPVFDWFAPDDFLLIETLEFLCRYNFQEVASDIIGFTYEEYIQKNARKRKGHFLTRDEVVEYMLDLLEYRGPQILGQSVFDPACGSGSFLVHASVRYRQALIESLCRKYKFSHENDLLANIAYRKELAQLYLDHLSSKFFGMELNPFACYLAEMNLLIQGLDDLHVLQQSGETHPIERFQIFNTDSLELPDEILENPDASGDIDNALWAPNLSDRLADEATSIKARSGDYAQGFFFIISNPPYINAAQAVLSEDYSNYPFYREILSGITNTYLLFLRLGMYYLGDGGRMVFIVPLTIIGDSSAELARKKLKLLPFRPTKITRFFTGNVLFPGVDQAVAIIRVDKDVLLRPDSTRQDWLVDVSGGYTIMEARHSQVKQNASLVFESTPASQDWQSPWLVSNEANSYAVWSHVRSLAKGNLAQLWEGHLEIKKGDVASDHINPFRLGKNHQPIQGDIAVQKGEDVFRYAPLAKTPSDWVRPKTGAINDSRSRAVNNTLLRVQRLATPEQGITLRKIARLNTRETLIATWFQRDSDNPFIFPDEHWRFRLLPTGDVMVAKGLLALLNSRIVAYLLNLFSTNNNVAQGELARLLIPDPKNFPAGQLATLTDSLLSKRAFIENEFVLKYSAKLPAGENTTVYIPPSRVLAMSRRMQKLSLEGWVMQGIVNNHGADTHKIKLLQDRKLIECVSNDQSYERVVGLFLDEPSRENQTWLQAQSWQLPGPVVATLWLQVYDDVCQQAQMHWQDFIHLQMQVDEIVADWYGLDLSMHDAIVQGLPLARRHRSENGVITVLQLGTV